ncbi:hypothetical protein D9611_008159 [Ephemerocybe angulata]|uniref:Uncharacterized protein n=2 Tax=Ephemerocybe angulata TaxID=980116 RepID=A0A8H6I7M0_9AGAR|nr:hypothetical protein D9611_008159 [Tulosesus angulatus]KAF6759374.1 hypothetical protein DFP72DRAFT_1004856 [Tulosesus angulatus]
MHFFISSFAVLSALILAASTGATPTAQLKVCDPHASGKGLNERRDAAIAGYADLILNKKDPQTAFDTYVPGDYIQHAPSYPGDGRQVTLNYLVPFFKANQVNFSKLKTYTGDGYAFMRYEVNVPPGEASVDGNFAGVNILRFQGTCFVEHWEILQKITGNETNPHAFF